MNNNNDNIPQRGRPKKKAAFFGASNNNLYADAELFGYNYDVNDEERANTGRQVDGSYYYGYKPYAYCEERDGMDVAGYEYGDGYTDGQYYDDGHNGNGNVNVSNGMDGTMSNTISNTISNMNNGMDSGMDMSSMNTMSNGMSNTMNMNNMNMNDISNGMNMNSNMNNTMNTISNTIGNTMNTMSMSNTMSNMNMNTMPSINSTMNNTISNTNMNMNNMNMNNMNMSNMNNTMNTNMNTMQGVNGMQDMLMGQDASTYINPWMNKKKRKNNPLLWQYIKQHQEFYPGIMHPSKYSSLDFVQGMNRTQKMYLGSIRRMPIMEKNNSNTILPLYLNSASILENSVHYAEFVRVSRSFFARIKGIDYENVTVQQLKNIMKEFGLNHTGKKIDLIERVKNTKDIIGEKMRSGKVEEKKVVKDVVKGMSDGSGTGNGNTGSTDGTDDMSSLFF